MCLSLLKAIIFKYRSEKFGLAFDELEVHVDSAFVHIHVGIENGALLEVDCALPIVNKLKKEKHLKLVTRITYDGGVLQWFEVDKLTFEIRLNILELCLSTLKGIMFHIWNRFFRSLVLTVSFVEIGLIT